MHSNGDAVQNQKKSREECRGLADINKNKKAFSCCCIATGDDMQNRKKCGVVADVDCQQQNKKISSCFCIATCDGMQNRKRRRERCRGLIDVNKGR